ncbi:hypothetical protein [Streptomyces sp. ODS28]|uniref:hypothetical protein n=1 Tax=Streptomyces sp. ODS28 TaxID=3136688 RepID=UPI0031E5E8F0
MPIEAMHCDMDLVTRTLGTPESVEATTVARNEDAAAVDATLRFDGTFARASVSWLMPRAWGARGGYTATFEHGVLDASSSMGFDGKPAGTVTAYTQDGPRELELPPADQYADMLDHVLACLRGEAANEIAPQTVLDALQLTLDIHHQVNG